MSLLYLFLFQCWGIRGSALSIEGKDLIIPAFSAHYFIDLAPRFSIYEEMEYWKKDCKEVEGTRSKECVFSSLSFQETIFFTLLKRKMELKLGPGIGIHLLKNYVKDRRKEGGWIITEYYTLNSNPIGFHIASLAEFNFSKFLLSGRVKFGVLLLEPGEENLFYTIGDIKEIVYSIGISF